MTIRSKAPALAALAAVLLSGAAAHAQDFSVYGDSALSLGYVFENGASMVGAPAGDLAAAFVSDVYLGFRQDDRYDFLADFRLAMDDPSEPGSPVAVSVAQCYVMIPFGIGQAYAGKRYREIGWSDFFNAVNRISPRAFSSSDFRGDPPLQAELGISAYPFSFSAVAWFDEATDWADARWLLSAACLYGGLSAELGAYLHDADDLHGYASARYATGAFSFFVDAIVDARAEQPIPVFDSGYSMQEQDDAARWSATAGLGYGDGGHSLRLEYLHRSQGYDAAQVGTFLDMVASGPAGMGAALASYSPFAFASDYAALNYDWAGAIVPELALRATAAASLPGFLKPGSFDWDAASAFAALRLGWSPRQELTVSLSGSLRFGGVRGEFVALSPALASVGLDGRLSF